MACEIQTHKTMQNQTAAHAYAHSYIAPELLARLRNLNNHKGHLPRQVNTFSSNHYHPGLITRRWYLPHSSLPFPHIITTRANGTRVDVYILKSGGKFVIHLKMVNCLWWVEKIFDHSDLALHVPSLRVSKKSATYRQIRKLSGMLFLSKLPRLSFSNASILIQELIISAYLQEIGDLTNEA